MRFWLSGSLSLLACLSANPQVKDAAAKKTSSTDIPTTHRNDELTLAGLRPGRDAMVKAQRLFTTPSAIGYGGSSRTWHDDCRKEILSVITDTDGTILEVRVAGPADADSKSDCPSSGASRWVTGHGLVIGDPSSRVLALYGQPGTRGPSTKGGQQLELFYYAFDWAGPEVPQVMTVLCTPDTDGKPGRVVEITLAAPSL
jgi:hypothetical protein